VIGLVAVLVTRRIFPESPVLPVLERGGPGTGATHWLKVGIEIAYGSLAGGTLLVFWRIGVVSLPRSQIGALVG
jgi:hypothetical protein